MKRVLLSLLLTASAWGMGENLLYLAPHDCDMSKKPTHGDHSEPTMFQAMNLEGNATARLVSPDLSVRDLAMEEAFVDLPKGKMGGYYALVVSHTDGSVSETAIRYLSRNGRPVKISPTKLTALPKSDLEIVPDPLFREHDRYTGSKIYRFKVTFHGTPLSNVPLSLETSNKTRHRYTTDPQGYARITLPDDFTNVKPGRGNRPAEFLLHTRHSDGGRLYVTSFAMPYSPNPNDHWQSQELGAGAVLLGFLGGMVLYRRHIAKGAKRG